MPELVRINQNYFDIKGLRCGLRRHGESEPCGGVLRVEDHRPKGTRGECRYEIFCGKCGTCDPNGWSRQDQLLQEAKRHFRAQKGE